MGEKKAGPQDTRLSSRRPGGKKKAMFPAKKKRPGAEGLVSFPSRDKKVEARAQMNQKLFRGGKRKMFPDRVGGEEKNALGKPSGATNKEKKGGA